MSTSINKVILVGNLGKDPEVRFNADGAKIVSLSLATSESWKDKNSGERRDRTEWHKVIIFNERFADLAEKFLKKGSKVYLEGQIQTRKWTDSEGKDRYITEIVLPKFRGELTLLEPKLQTTQSDYYSDNDSNLQNNNQGSYNHLNDEIPF